MTLPLLPLLVVLGACIGSFLNVVVYRLPRGLSVWHPPSHCPHCHTRLRPWDNVPVLGWLWLRGRCRYCGAGIAPRYPLVEAAMALWFALAWWRFEASLTLLGALVLGAWLFALALIDQDTLTLPDGLLKSGLVLGLLWQCTQGWPGVVGGIWGMVVGIWLLDAVGWLASVILGQTALGGGDPKLAALLGAWLHWPLLLVALFIAVVTGAGAGILGRLTGRLRRGQPMPFGPFLAVGGGVSLLFGSDLLHWYLAGFVG